MKPFGIMLHHFYDENIHLKGQGAISKDEFNKLLDFIEKKHNIIPAKDWTQKAIENSLKQNEVCLTFDDGLRCQYDIAMPVLEQRNLTAFWFVYSSVFYGEIGKLELYRYFRTPYFNNVEEFYIKFEKKLLESNDATIIQQNLQNFDPKKYLIEHTIYSDSDRRFRFLRDKVLGPKHYEFIMDMMIMDSDIDKNQIQSLLWMDNDCLRMLDSLGHIVGLHSYTHPTDLKNFPEKVQLDEYKKNFNHLNQVLGSKPKTMSHPCNSYNNKTLKILTKLGVKIGFRSNINQNDFSSLEFPREDHSTIMKEVIKN